MNKPGYQPILALVVGMLAAATAVGQNRLPADPNSQVQPAPRIRSDETFDLNIPEKHFTEQDFEASTSVGLTTDDPKRLTLQIGVALRAQTIKVDLRNVTGTVRFRGSVQRILDLLNARQSTPSPP